MRISIKPLLWAIIVCLFSFLALINSDIYAYASKYGEGIYGAGEYSVNIAPSFALSKIGTVSYQSGINTYYYTGLNPTFSGTGEVGATVSLRVNGVLYSSKATVDSNGNWSLGGYTFSTGSHTVQLTAADAAGNQTSIAFTLVVDPTWGLFPDWLVAQLGGVADEEAPPEGFPGEEETPGIQGNTVTVRLTDPEGNPLAGISVTLSSESSEPQTATTDENGKATFTKVPPGEYTLSFEYGGGTVERKLNLLGDEQDYNIDITVGSAPSGGYYFGVPWYIWLLVVGLGALAAGLIVRRRRTA